MKSVKILGLTSHGKLVIKEASSGICEGTFEGFSVGTDVFSRWGISKLGDKHLQCSLSSTNKIRYHNMDFFTGLLKSAVIKVSQPELDDSKVFTSEEKTILKDIEPIREEVAQIRNQFLDFTFERQPMKKIFNKKITFKESSIQWLGEQILIKVSVEGKPAYVPVVLKHIDHYFMLVPPKEFYKFILRYSSTDVTLLPVRYNLFKKRYEVEAIFNDQFESQIIQNGWGTLTHKNLVHLTPKVINKLRQTEKKAKANNLGIFKKPFEILSFIYTKNNLIGTVHEVLQGYIFKVRVKNQIMKIQLSMIYCPIMNELGAFECRQYARRSLIGKQVNIFLKKDQGLNIHGSFVRLSDNKDIESLILENGFGLVKEELKGSLMSAKFQNLEKKAREKKRGIHNQATLGGKHFEDLTIAHSKKDKVDKRNVLEGKLKFLRDLGDNDEGVIEKIIDATTYIIRVDSLKKIIRVKLDGVKKLKANPRLEEVQQLNNRIKKFSDESLLQRTVFLELNDFERTQNAFMGMVRVGKGREKISIQEILINEGFIYINRNAYFEEQWKKTQEKAEIEGKNIWSQNLKQLMKFQSLEEIPHEFEGRFSWVENGELAYVQPRSVFDQLDQITQQLNEKPTPIDEKDLVIGFLCSAPYLGDRYRAKIVTIADKVIVEFIDWGNRERIDAKQLMKIDEKLQYLPPLCNRVCLDVVQEFHGSREHLDRVREYMMEGQFKFVQVYGNVVNVYRENLHLNHQLVEEAYLKADLTKVHDEKLKSYFEEVMQKLRKNLDGIWDYEGEPDLSDLSENFD